MPRTKDAKPEQPAPLRVRAPLHRPAPAAPRKPVAWTFLTLPPAASAKLPSRAQVSVQGTLNDASFTATLDPDGKGGHWLKVPRKLRESAGAQPRDVVSLEITPLAKEPEPKIPADLRRALTDAPPEARNVWKATTPLARRDWIHWITSAKQAETRQRRIVSACDMLAKGKKRPCCFDRSGMYSKSLAAPGPDHLEPAPEA
jgi:hypothetical protein